MLALEHLRRTVVSRTKACCCTIFSIIKLISSGSNGLTR